MTFMRITLTADGEQISRGEGGCFGISYKAVEVIQVRDGGYLKHCRDGIGDKWLDSGYF